MQDALFSSLSLVGGGGFVIIGAIVVLMVLAIATSLTVSARYAGLVRALGRDADDDPERPFRHRVLDRIWRDAHEALRRNPREVNTQAIIEHNFQVQLGGLLLGERFCKAATGLAIILGLVGTFYGLMLSIGRLVSLLADDVGPASDVTQSLTRGLTQAVAGMSVAFSTSLFGVGAAILLTLFGVFFSIADRRIAAMVQIEHHLDNVLLAAAPRELEDPFDQVVNAGATAASPLATRKLEQLVGNFGESVARLESVVGRFDSALQSFSSTTRDFREFNLHLKDNVQRMSLGFADLSETLKTQVSGLKTGDRR